jgi:hypothetical protein
MQPFWYANNFAIVSSGFASAFRQCPHRLLILPPYHCSATSYNVDGVHFTPGEGERYLSSEFLTYYILLTYHFDSGTREQIFSVQTYFV